MRPHPSDPQARSPKRSNVAAEVAPKIYHTRELAVFHSPCEWDSRNSIIAWWHQLAQVFGLLAASLQGLICCMFLFVSPLFGECRPHRLISMKLWCVCVCVRMSNRGLTPPTRWYRWYCSPLNIWKGAMVGYYIIFLKTPIQIGDLSVASSSNEYILSVLSLLALVFATHMINRWMFA